MKRRQSIAREVKRSSSLPTESKRELVHRKLSRPSFNQKSFSPDRGILWEESTPRNDEEAADQARRLSVAIYGSYRKDSVPRGRLLKVLICHISPANSYIVRF